METSTIITIIVIAVVVIAVIAVLAFLLKKRRQDQHRQQANGLRSEAMGRRQSVEETRDQARLADADAQRKRAEADRADARAAEARQVHAQEEAEVEDTLRHADHLDPGVDHRSDDYQPTTDRSTTTDPTRDDRQRPAGT